MGLRVGPRAEPSAGASHSQRSHSEPLAPLPPTPTHPTHTHTLYEHAPPVSLPPCRPPRCPCVVAAVARCAHPVSPALLLRARASAPSPIGADSPLARRAAPPVAQKAQTAPVPHQAPSQAPSMMGQVRPPLPSLLVCSTNPEDLLTQLTLSRSHSLRARSNE